MKTIFKITLAILIFIVVSLMAKKVVENQEGSYPVEIKVY